MKKASLPRDINLLLANMARSLAAEVARAVRIAAEGSDNG